MLELPLLFLLLGLVIGATAAWLLARFRMEAKINAPETITQHYLYKDLEKRYTEQIAGLQKSLADKEEDLLISEKQNARLREKVESLTEKLNTQQAHFDQLQKQAQSSFENIAHRLFDENSKKLSATHQEKLTAVLTPLKEKIREFEQDIERKFRDETKDIISLKKEIEQLRNLNEQLSSDANNLASALKGNTKTQGDWGEIQLEILLEKAGLTKNIHFRVQPSFKNENGQDRRPDFIIHLPAKKHLIIDSKVSLTAYERFFNATSETEKQTHLKDHIASLRNHIRDLSSKNYQQLYQINSPDYLLLFVPVEPAFTAAIQADSRLFLEALDRNVVIVTTSTLLATMRTVSYIWRQEKQKKSVLEIARQSGRLYDKFVAFVDDLKTVGKKMDDAQSAYHQAMNKLSDSKKFGDTLIGRAQKIKQLGAKASKSLPDEYLEED
ncbi:MAG: DNA recombination protein RmuC [Bacteroidetes bacterium]|nr:MAG: DNA recombination protein RmuC [Bacteroidota bacterium]